MGTLEKTAKAAPTAASSTSSVTTPLMIALGTFLIGKVMSPAAAASQPSPAPQADGAEPGGEILGGLSSLLAQLTSAGHGDTVSSWLGGGKNAPVEPQQLEPVLGKDTVGAVAQQTGMSEQDVLAGLAKALPGLVDKLTPNGQLPSIKDIAALLQR